MLTENVDAGRITDMHGHTFVFRLHSAAEEHHGKTAVYWAKQNLLL